ncbi:MAG TPA: peptide chain release factor N(5)-glutamine methyltransferase [Clostridiales bacterium]|nr:peptide chain release factor N(5)-glutamine methyltransferase [Clostridiales bacterium]
MTAGQAIQQALHKLREYGIGSPLTEAALLMCRVIQRDRSFVLAHPEFPLSPKDMKTFESLVERRCTGEPYSYIAGSREFLGMEFKTGPGVLSPRPETERLVETAIDWIRSLQTQYPGKVMRVLDLGTGTGCIAAGMAAGCRDIRVLACDVSPDALAYARRNIQKLAPGFMPGSRVELIQADMTAKNFESAVRSWLRREQAGEICVVLSNPPYIPSGEIGGLSPEVSRFEPRLALDGGEDGLLFYRVIAVKAARLLEPGGLLVLEVGAGQCEAVGVLLEQAGYKVQAPVCDYAGIRRVVTGVTAGHG